MPQRGFKLLNGMKNMRWWEWVLLVFLIILPFVGGFLGAKFFNTGIYKSGKLKKPDWAPPAIVFSPVWTVLYIMMGISSFLMFKLGGGLNRDTITAGIFYFLQLLFNWTWTPLFFGYQLFNAGGMVISATWALVLACIVTFIPISKAAGVLLIPYYLWLSFAGALNYAIVCLNGCQLENTTSPS